MAIKLNKQIGYNMKITKIAFATASALLLSTAISSAQTTVGGNMRIGIKATSADTTGGIGSNTMFTKETQINVANKGNLNIGGLSYAAGFSLEYDGDEAGAIGNHYEGNYINLINASSGTTLHFGADVLKPTDYQLSDIVAGPISIEHIGVNAANTTAGVAVKETNYAQISGNGKNESFGVGIIQNVGTMGTVRAIYIPDTTQALSDTGSSTPAGATSNSHKAYSFAGSLGVPGLTVLYGKVDQSDSGTSKGVDVDTYGIKYTVGQFTAAYQKADGQATSTIKISDNKQYGLAYAATKDLTIGLAMIKTKAESGMSGTAEEEIKGINIGYSLGPVSLQVVAGSIDNAAGVTGQDGKALHMTLGTTF